MAEPPIDWDVFGIVKTVGLGRVATRLWLDGVNSIVYFPSRMKLRATFERVGKLIHPWARGVFFFLSFFLLLQLVGQPDLDDQHPAVGARLVTAKILKQYQPAKSSPCHGWQPCLAVGRQLFTPGFYWSFVRLPGRLDFVHASIVFLRPGRSPPAALAL